MACISSVVILVILVTWSLVILASSTQLCAGGRYGKRGELSPRKIFWSGSRYGRSSAGGDGRRQQEWSSPVDNGFFISSRYGKRSKEPPATTDGSVGLPEVLLLAEEKDNSLVTCTYTRVRNSYHCYTRKENSSEYASSEHK